MNKQILMGISALLISCGANADFSSKTVVQLHHVQSSGIESWLERDTGQTRYGEQDRLVLGQAISAVDYTVGEGLSLHGVLRYQSEQDVGLGITQLFAQYKPLWSPKFRPRFKVGLFYPEMSFENVDTGWLSPFTYSFSAINSWIAEEQRTAGVEVKLDIISSPKAAHKYSVTGATFKGNDTLGTLLAWRGWAVHDRQTTLNETIFFETYPSIGPNSRLATQAAWVEPSREIDHNLGFYLGGEWNYRGKSKVRYFYYDNNGDKSTPPASGGQFSWETRFHSLAWQYRFNKEWRLIAQTMQGDSDVWNSLIKFDFSASYIMLNYRQGKHLISGRYDWFETVDKDGLDIDNNSGDGEGITLAYKYRLSDAWRFGAEYLYLDTFRANRGQWPDRALNVKQQQWLAVAEYRF